MTSAECERVVDTHTLAYLAGFVDGEGTLVIYNRHPEDDVADSWAVRLVVANRHRGPLDLLNKVFGGRIYEVSHAQKLIWRWYATGPRTKMVLPQLLPYLVIKAERARLVLEFLTGSTTSGLNYSPEQKARRREMVRRLRELNGEYNENARMRLG